MAAAADTPPGRPESDTAVARVVDMLDSLAAADVTLTITGLEDLLVRLREAEAARALLSGVDRRTLKAALLLRRQRADASGRR